MLTFDSIKKEHPEMDEANIEAFLRFARCFDCLDANTFDEANEKILISMEMLSDELEFIEDPEEQRELMAQRYSKFSKF
jgi:hypothetical protein